ncbi:MAG: hypothetical protein CK425_02780 [Parachlamydia sp.]|nr:MAG: hypothetical protein CK425_02780 [Parachlamydia sp.]
MINLPKIELQLIIDTCEASVNIWLRNKSYDQGYQRAKSSLRLCFFAYFALMNPLHKFLKKFAKKAAAELPFLEENSP